MFDSRSGQLQLYRSSLLQDGFRDPSVFVPIAVPFRGAFCKAPGAFQKPSDFDLKPLFFRPPGRASAPEVEKQRFQVKIRKVFGKPPNDLQKAPRDNIRTKTEGSRKPFSSRLGRHNLRSSSSNPPTNQL